MILLVWIFILLIIIGLYFDWKQKKGKGYQHAAPSGQNPGES